MNSVAFLIVPIDCSSRHRFLSHFSFHISHFPMLCTGATIMSLWIRVPVAGQFFALAMALDIATGVLVAGHRGLWSSRGMSPGLRIKGGEALLIGLLFVIENQTHAPLGTAVASWFAFRELGSSLENLARLGVQIPPWLGRSLALLERDGAQSTPPPPPSSSPPPTASEESSEHHSSFQHNSTERDVREQPPREHLPHNHI
jgi:hypothetical protein